MRVAFRGRALRGAARLRSLTEDGPEDEAARERPHSTFIEVPNELVAVVQELIAKHDASSQTP